MTSQPNSPQPQDGLREDGPDMVIIRERKKSRKRKRKNKSGVPKAVKVIAVVVIVLAVVAGLAFWFVNHSIKKGDEQLHTPVVEDTAQTITYGGHTYRYNDNVIAVMVMGKDDESSYGTDRTCTDANMLVTLDTETKELDVIAIPRDSMVDVDLYQDGEYTRTGPYQLAVAYGVDVPDEDAAARNTLKSVSKLFYNLPISRYFVLEMDAVGRLSEAVGGVQVQALDVYPGANFQVGDDVLLSGDAALKYVKYRDINIDESAQDREARQMQFVKAFLQETRASDPLTVIDLYNAVQDSTRTNLDFNDISYLASVFADGGVAATKLLSVSGTTKLEPDDDGIDREHVYLDEDSVMKAVLEAFYTQID